MFEIVATSKSGFRLIRDEDGTYRLFNRLGYLVPVEGDQAKEEFQLLEDTEYSDLLYHG